MLFSDLAYSPGEVPIGEQSGRTACQKEETASSIQAQRESPSFPTPCISMCAQVRDGPKACRGDGGGQSAGRGEMGREGGRVVEDDGRGRGAGSIG